MSIHTRRQVVSRTWREGQFGRTCTHAEGPNFYQYTVCGVPAVVEREVVVRYIITGHEETTHSYFCRLHADMRKFTQPELPVRPKVEVVSAQFVKRGNGTVQIVNHNVCIVSLDAPGVDKLPPKALVAVPIFPIGLQKGDRVAVARTISTKLRATKL